MFYFLVSNIFGVSLQSARILVKSPWNLKKPTCTLPPVLWTWNGYLVIFCAYVFLCITNSVFYYQSVSSKAWLMLYIFIEIGSRCDYAIMPFYIDIFYILSKYNANISSFLLVSSKQYPFIIIKTLARLPLHVFLISNSIFGVNVRVA